MVALAGKVETQSQELGDLSLKILEVREEEKEFDSVKYIHSDGSLTSYGDVYMSLTAEVKEGEELMYIGGCRSDYLCVAGYSGNPSAETFISPLVEGGVHTTEVVVKIPSGVTHVVVSAYKRGHANYVEGTRCVVRAVSSKLNSLDKKISTLETSINSKADVKDLESLNETTELAVNGGERKVVKEAVYTPEHYITISGEVGGLAEIKKKNNVTFVCATIDMKRGEKVSYLSLRMNSINILPFVFIDKNNIIVEKSDLSGISVYMPIEGVFTAPCDGIFYYNAMPLKEYYLKQETTETLEGVIGLNGRMGTLNTNVEALGNEVEKVKKNTSPQVESVIGKDALRVTAESLSDGQIIELTDFPYANKTGNRYAFGGKFSGSFGSIYLCQGYNTYRSLWFAVNSSSIELWYQPNKSSSGKPASVVETVQHGLNITDFVRVNLSIDDDCKARLQLFTRGGAYIHTFEKWSENANGIPSVRSVGTALTNVAYSATNRRFRCPVWVFGSSYEGLSKQRWCGQIKLMGYFDFLLNSKAGRSTLGNREDLERALNFGCPKYLVTVASIGNDVTLANLKTRFTDLKAVADAHGMEVIVTCPADTPNTPKAEVREFLANTGCRLIHSGEAVSADINDGNAWYNGYLASDNVHPTELGAIAMAHAVCEDFPEIMQYGESTGNVENNDGNDDYGDNE